MFKRILDVMEERGETLSKQVIAISHGDDLAAAQEMKEMIIERFHPVAVELHVIGSTIACHAGPGTIAVFFLNELYPEAL